MKKLYTFLATAVAFTTVSAFGTAPELRLTSPAELGSAEAPDGLYFAKKADRQVNLQKSTSGKALKAKAKAPAGEWKNIGKGTYLEDLLTIYSDVPANQMWEVDVEQSASEPGWYRILPYASGPVADLLGGGDTENYLYINATDPEKVYAEDFAAFGSFNLSNLVPEAEWNDFDSYGTLKDGIIEFPTRSFVIYSSGWKFTCNNTGLKLALPGSKLEDYSFTASSPYCAVDGKNSVTVIGGSDVAYAKYIMVSGWYTVDSYKDYIAANGTKINVNVRLSASPTARNIYTFMAVAYNAADEVVGASQCYFFACPDEDDQWADMGTGSFSEGIYAAGYSDIDEETFTVTVQKHKTKAGYYRLVNPYKDHTVLGGADYATECGEHANHYLYIDASRPEYVVLEGGPVGVNVSGEGAIYSYGAKYVGSSNEEAAKNANYFGTYDSDSRTISFSDNTILLGESDYDNGKFYYGNTNTKLVLPDDSGVSDIITSDTTSDRCEYFNIYGQRVDNPAPGQVLIKRQGSKVQKFISK